MLMCTQGPGRPASTDAAPQPDQWMVDYRSTFICCNTCWTRHTAIQPALHTRLLRAVNCIVIMASSGGWLNIEIFPVVVAEGCGVVMLCLEWSRGLPHLLPPPGRAESWKSWLTDSMRTYSFQLRRNLVIKYFSGQTWKTVGMFPTFWWR